MSTSLHKISPLEHGGIMANYQCNAACRHCLYACSPERTGGYIRQEMADEICQKLRAGGCRSVHIGGGEPFLDINGLINLLETARLNGITVEYIETNAFWAADEHRAKEYLSALTSAGADTLCISLDPFHAEYVPAALPIKLSEICRKEGFGYFVWQDKYRRTLSGLDTPQNIQTRADLERQLSANYILETAQAYGLRMGGRALSIEAEYGTPKQLEKIINTSQTPNATTKKSPCQNLLASGHFHVDLYGQYIPPGCTGIVLPLEEAISGVPKGKYPAFDALLTGGVQALYDLAQSLGFKAAANYTSGCALCFHLRHWLSRQPGFPELDPEHYAASLTYY
ncbi:MAG: radical SAM protein [Defluviitaleaceae bacterium]|nr:radical SAM protein [Defluviitaleaceae bacterium]